MANKLSILGIMALFAAVPVSANTFFQFVQNPGTPLPLLIVADQADDGLISVGYTTVSLTDALIMWDLPSTLGAGPHPGLLSFSVTTNSYATGDSIANTLTETGFTGTASIVDPTTHDLILSWTFELGDSTALTVANNGYAGSFVDSSPLHVVSAPVFTNAELTSTDFTSQRFNLSFYAASPPHGTIWTSDGLPIIYGPNGGTCTDCRLAPNEADLVVPEPATMAMIGFGLIGLGFLGRKRFVR